MSNNTDRRDFSVAASQEAQENFNRVASRLETLMTERDRDVKAAMADYSADGVSEGYAGKEARWNTVAGEVRTIISTLRGALEKNDSTAQDSLSRAKAAVEKIG